ncbi:MAG: hypothetical protein ACE5H9_18820 [Anaerolineae bacterium]
MLVCLGLSVGGGLVAYRALQRNVEDLPISLIPDQDTDLEGPAEDAGEAVEASPTPTPVPPTATPTESPPSATPTTETGSQTEEPEPTPTRRTLGSSREPTPTSPPAAAAPVIEELFFSAEPLEAGQAPEAMTTFPSDTAEVHAIFSYSGFTSENEWSRVWYLDGEEFATFSDLWTGDEAGSFDYSISPETEDGSLDPGEWALELYIDGQLLASGQFTIEEPEPVVTTRNFKLAYSVWDGGKHLLFISNIDGSGRQFILERAAGPSWTTDGRSLYIYGEEGVDRQIRDGTEYTWPDAGISNGVVLLSDVLTVGSGIPDAFQDPGWKDGSARATALAPGGQMLAFDAARGGPDRRIYFFGTSDNQQFKFEILGEQPSWAPDSNQLAYRSCRENKCGIWISNRDDSNAHVLTLNGGDAFPSWSPDGRQIAFSRDMGGNHDIFVINTDGSSLRQLTNSPGHDTLPVWTPDGRRIVFRSARSGSWGIYVMNADGSGQTLIIPDAALGPDWSFGKMDVY